MNEGKRPRVLYVVWNEAIWAGVALTQATEVVCAVQRQGYADMTLLAFQPLVLLLRDRARLRHTLDELSEAGVRTYIIPTPLVFSRYMLPRSFLIPFFLCIMVPAALLFASHETDLIHPRGYMAGLAALIAGKILGRPFIFDPRSPFPEEQVRAREWRRDSHHYLLWKGCERRLLHSACSVVVTSEPFRADLAQTAPTADYSVIYNNASGMGVGDPAPGVERAQLGLKRSDIVVAYVGTIGKWNDAGTYAAFHKRVSQIGKRIRFLYIVPPRSRQAIASALAAQGVADNDYHLVSVEPGEVPAYLSLADVGIQLMSEPDARLGVKIAEYLAAGLPIIVNQHARGAAVLIRDAGVGLVVDLDDDKFPSQVIHYLGGELWGQCRVSVSRVRGEFSTAHVAEQYGAIYQRIRAGMH